MNSKTIYDKSVTVILISRVSQQALSQTVVPRTQKRNYRIQKRTHGIMTKSCMRAIVKAVYWISDEK